MLDEKIIQYIGIGLANALHLFRQKPPVIKDIDNFKKDVIRLENCFLEFEDRLKLLENSYTPLKDGMLQNNERTIQLRKDVDRLDEDCGESFKKLERLDVISAHNTEANKIVRETLAAIANSLQEINNKLFNLAGRTA